jgi:hypothetical protein
MACWKPAPLINAPVSISAAMPWPFTGADSNLDKFAVANHWLARFPMWDWVGGRTSETSDVGLLPMALQGFDVDAFLEGAMECDKITRINNVKANPAALLALAWYYIGNGKGAKDMVILPYKDRLELFSRYLQQLVMESLGKGAISTAISFIKASPSMATRGPPINTPTSSNSGMASTTSSLHSLKFPQDRAGAPFFVQDERYVGRLFTGFFARNTPSFV